MNALGCAKSEQIALAHSQSLTVETDYQQSLVKLVSAEGVTTLTIRVTPSGPVLEFAGGLSIQASGDLVLSAQRIGLHAREGLALTSDGDAYIQAAGDMHCNARIQNITADLGNVNVRANDDVRLNGERIMVNC